MRSLTSTLLAAQKSASGKPYVKAVVGDYWGDRVRLRFTRLYTGSEAGSASPVIGAGDGSLVRARYDAGVLYTQRVANPGPGSDFSVWTSHGGVSTVSGFALAWRPVSNQVVLFYVAADTVTLTYKVSTDNGATWGGANVLEVAAAAVGALALAYNPSGAGAWFWVVGAAGVRAFLGAGPSVAWSNTVATATGLAARHFLDWQVIVTGTAVTSLDPAVWACIFGDGVDQASGTWSGLTVVTAAAAASNVSFGFPAVEQLSDWRLFFVESYSGSVAYTRLQRATMSGVENFKQARWSEAAVFNWTATHGVGCSAFNLGGYFWLSAPAGVWRARSPTIDDVDLSAYVLEATVEIEEGDGKARVVLQDVAAVTAVVARGMRLKLAAGYYSSAGAEASEGPAYWVEWVERVTSPAGPSGRDGPRIVLHCRDAWWLLERWRARRQLVWSAGAATLSQILAFIGCRAGLDVAGVSSSAAFTTLTPAFTVHPGESGRTAVRRLLEMVPDVPFMRSGVLYTLNPLAADASAYSFGTDHAIVSARYVDAGLAVNRAQVFGAAVFDEEFDFADIDAFGESIGQAKDLNVTTSGQAGDRADFGLRESTVRSRRDELQVSGVNCGQELYDVVDLTDAQVGLSAAKRRVLGLTWRYLTGAGRRGLGAGRYEMTVRLGLA